MHEDSVFGVERYFDGFCFSFGRAARNGMFELTD